MQQTVGRFQKAIPVKQNICPKTSHSFKYWPHFRHWRFEHILLILNLKICTYVKILRNDPITDMLTFLLYSPPNLMSTSTPIQPPPKKSTLVGKYGCTFALRQLWKIQRSVLLCDIRSFYLCLSSASLQWTNHIPIPNIPGSITSKTNQTTISQPSFYTILQ